MNGIVGNEANSTANYLGRIQDLLERSISRLSSGSKIVSPSDDPQGTGLSQKIIAQNRRIQAAQTNVQNATSFLQSADGFASSMNTMVSRMSELTIMASDVMKNGGDIALYQTEFNGLQEQLRATIGGTAAEIGGTGVSKPLGVFNGQVLFGPNPGGTPVATSDTAGENVALPELDLRSGNMLALIQQDSSGNYGLSVTDPTALTKINAAIQDLTDARSTIGGVARRFEVVSANLTKRGEDLTRTISNITDTDTAAESTRLAKYQTLSQSATAMLAQANVSPRAILQMLQTG